MMTTRALTPDGLGDKTHLERENKWLAAQGLPLTQVQLVDIRQAWEQVANVHLARAELDQKIDSRSHAERGIEIEPTLHMGVHATQMERRGKEVSQRRLDPDSARRNAELIREKPEQVLCDPDRGKERVRPARRGADAASLYRRRRGVPGGVFAR